MHLLGPTTDVSEDCERILRSLPLWFGIEEALKRYVRDSERYPTFVICEQQLPSGFMTVREHFPESWEVHCIAIHAENRGRGFGRKLHEYAEKWIRANGGKFVQVKTVGASHPSLEYVETRKFYKAIGYTPLETFQEIWGPDLPVLQLIKCLNASSTEV